MSTRHLMPFGILFVILALLMLIPSSRAAPLEASQLADQVWVRLGGPPGGLGYDIRMSYSDPDVMFVTDAMAGIHKSTDRGRTWYITNEGTDLRQGQSGDIIPVFSATVDPNNSDIVWIGLKDLGGVYRSEDGGQTWERRTNGIVESIGLTIRGIGIQPGNSDIVFVAGEVASDVWAGRPLPGSGFDMVQGVVYKSTDAGQNWRAVWRGDNLARYVLIDPNDVNTIYVSTGIFDRDAANSEWETRTPGGVGVLKSTDGGESWVEVNNGLENLYINSLDFHPDNSQILIAGAMHLNYPEGGGVYITHDGGENWHYLIGYGISAVEFADENPDYVYAAGQVDFCRSTDGGDTWEYLQNEAGLWGPENMIVGIPMDFQVDPENPNKVFVNTYQGGNFYSEDAGITWEPASRGYSGATMRDIDIHPGNPSVVYASGRSGYFVSYNGGLTWKGITPQGVNMEGTEIGVDPRNPDHLLMGDGDHGCIFETFDAGGLWSERVCQWDSLQDLLDTVPDESFIHQGILSYAFTSSDPEIVYGGFGIQQCFNNFDRYYCDEQSLRSVAISTDGGQTWQWASDPNLDSLTVPEIAVHPNNADIAWVATAGNGIMRTTDGGETWQPASASLSNKVVTTVAVDPQNPDTLFAGVMNEGLYLSKDGGASWLASSAGMDPNEPIRTIAVDPQRSNIIYAGSWRSGVFVSEDGGGTWRRINEGLTNRSVIDLAISSDGQTLYASTDGGGVFRLSTLGQEEFDALSPIRPTPASAPTAAEMSAVATDEATSTPAELPTATETPETDLGTCPASFVPLALAPIALVASARRRRRVKRCPKTE